MNSENNIKRAGELIMQSNKDTKAGITPMPQPKHDPSPMYEINKNVQAEIGYGKPKIPWASKVLPKSRFISAHESPLKEWWMEEQRRKSNLKL
jgi:hypothetical protein